MGARDHACEGCGRGGINDDRPCICGEVVEWTMAMGKVARGRVTRIVEGRVYVEMRRTNIRGRVVTSEVWFEEHEADRLRIAEAEKELAGG